MTESQNKTSFASNEPVIVGGFVAWLLSLAGTFILGHTDIVTSTQWSTLSTVLIPIISAVVLGVIAKVTREVVKPAWKAVEQVPVKVGIPDSVFNEFVSKAVQGELDNLRTQYPQFASVLNEVESHQSDPGVDKVKPV